MLEHYVSDRKTLGCLRAGLIYVPLNPAYRSLDGGESWEMIHYRQLNGSTRVRPARPAIAASPAKRAKSFSVVTSWAPVLCASMTRRSTSARVKAWWSANDTHSTNLPPRRSSNL